MRTAQGESSSWAAAAVVDLRQLGQLLGELLLGVLPDDGFDATGTRSSQGQLLRQRCRREPMVVRHPSNWRRKKVIGQALEVGECQRFDLLNELGLKGGRAAAVSKCAIRRLGEVRLRRETTDEAQHTGDPGARRWRIEGFADVPGLIK